MTQLNSFAKEVCSMQEKRVSTLILCLLACMSLAFYLFIAREDIPETLLVIIQTLIYIVGGVNGLNIFTKIFNSNKIEEKGGNYGD